MDYEARLSLSTCCKLHLNMPRKIRELIFGLEQFGFVNRGGEGSHRNFKHKKGVKIIISGQLGDDAKFWSQNNERNSPIPKNCRMV